MDVHAPTTDGIGSHLGQCIPGLDLILPHGPDVGANGGTSILCVGPAGAGKTLFLLSVARSIAQQGLFTLLATVGQRVDILKRQLEGMRWEADDSRDAKRRWRAVEIRSPRDVLGCYNSTEGVLFLWNIEEAAGASASNLRAIITGAREALGQVAADSQMRLRGVGVDGLNRLVVPPVTESLEEIGTLFGLADQGLLMCCTAEEPLPGIGGSLRAQVLEEAFYYVNIAVELSTSSHGDPGKRGIRICKSRTQNSAHGWHNLRLDDHGLHVYPDPATWEQWGLEEAKLDQTNIVYEVRQLGLIREGETTLLRGPDNTLKRNFCMGFAGLTRAKQPDSCAWTLNFANLESHGVADDPDRQVLSSIGLIRDRPSTSTPVEQVFYDVHSLARDRIKGTYGGGRAIIIGPGYFRHHGLSDDEVYRVVEALVCSLRRLGYTVLVVETSTRIEHHFLDPIFDNVFITSVLTSRHSGKAQPGIARSRSRGVLVVPEFMYALRTPSGGLSVQRISDWTPEPTVLALPVVQIRLHYETEAQQKFIGDLQAVLETQFNIGADAGPRVSSFGPNETETVLDGIGLHAYPEHLNQCVIDCFDEFRAAEFIGSHAHSRDRIAFDQLDRVSLADSEWLALLRRFPPKSMSRVSLPDGEGGTAVYAVPWHLNCSVLAADIGRIRVGLEQVGRDSPRRQSMPEHVLQVLDSTDRHVALQTIAARDEWGLMQWVQAATAATEGLGQQPRAPVLELSGLSPETLNCFILGFLWDMLFASGSASPVEETPQAGDESVGAGDSPPAGSQTDDLVGRIRDLVAVLDRAGCMTRKRTPREKPWYEAGTMSALVSYQWYTTYRGCFDARSAPRAEGSYYYLTRPSDMHMFSGDWYLAVRRGSVALDHAIRCLEFLVSKRMQSRIASRGVGIPCWGVSHAAGSSEPDDTELAEILGSYRFYVPAGQIWQDTVSRLQIPGYGDVRELLHDRFRQFLAYLSYGVGDRRERRQLLESAAGNLARDLVGMLFG